MAERVPRPPGDPSSPGAASRSAQNAGGRESARREGVSHVRDGLDRVLRHLRSPSAREVVSVFTLWPSLVGPHMADHTSVVSLRDGELVVAVDDPAWAAQLRWLEPQLLERLASELGSDRAVRAIRLRVAPKR